MTHDKHTCALAFFFIGGHIIIINTYRYIHVCRCKCVGNVLKYVYLYIFCKLYTFTCSTQLIKRKNTKEWIRKFAHFKWVAGCPLIISTHKTLYPSLVKKRAAKNDRQDAWRKYLCNIHYEDIVTSPRSMNTTHSHTITQPTNQMTHIFQDFHEKKTVIWMKSRGNLACNFFGEKKNTIDETIPPFISSKTATLIKEITIILKQSPCMITFCVTTLDRNHPLPPTPERFNLTAFSFL